MNLPKTLNKKFHHMIEEYNYCTYDKLHDVLLKEEFQNGNDGQQLLEPTVKDLNRAFANCVEIEIEETEEIEIESTDAKVIKQIEFLQSENVEFEIVTKEVNAALASKTTKAAKEVLENNESQQREIIKLNEGFMIISPWYTNKMDQKQMENILKIKYIKNVDELGGQDMWDAYLNFIK